MSRKARGADEGEDLAVVEREAGAADGLAEVPGGVPVGIGQADPPLARDRGADPRVEGGEVEGLLRPQRVADGAEAVAVDVGLAGQQVDGAGRVEEHLGHALDAGMAAGEPVDGLAESASAGRTARGSSAGRTPHSRDGPGAGRCACPRGPSSPAGWRIV